MISCWRSFVSSAAHFGPSTVAISGSCLPSHISACQIRFLFQIFCFNSTPQLSEKEVKVHLHARDETITVSTALEGAIAGTAATKGAGAAGGAGAASSSGSGSSEYAHVKLRNSGADYSRAALGAAAGVAARGGVDDLVSLPHLHEPAILDVLDVRYANDCICASAAAAAARCRPATRPLALALRQRDPDERLTPPFTRVSAHPLPPLPCLRLRLQTPSRAPSCWRSTPSSGCPSTPRRLWRSTTRTASRGRRAWRWRRCLRTCTPWPTPPTGAWWTRGRSGRWTTATSPCWCRASQARERRRPLRS